MVGGGPLYRAARRFKHVHPADAAATYIGVIASAIAKATPETAYDVSVDAIADAIVTALYSCPKSSKHIITSILDSVEFKNSSSIWWAVQRKKIAVRKEQCDRMALLSPEVQNNVEALKALQKQHDEFEKKMFDEIDDVKANCQNQDDANLLMAVEAVETKYHKSFNPLYEKRRNIVAGACMTDEGAKKGVPKFWLKAMNAVKDLQKEITKADARALKFLLDVKCVKTDDPKALKFQFYFDPNPYFKNTVLTKIYHLSDRSTAGDEIEAEKAVETEINWKNPKHCLTHTIVRKRKARVCEMCKGPLPNKIGKRSFFNFFNSPGDDMTRDICNALQKELIPHAVTWFLNPQVIEEEIQAAEMALKELLGY